MDWLTAFAGAILCGGVAVMAPPGAPEAECEAAGCALEIRDPDRWNTWLADAETACAAFESHAVSPDDEALIAFTSGTSGRPKPVRLDHRGITSGLRNMMLGAALAAMRKRCHQAAPARPASPSVLLMAPLYHVGGYGQFLLMALLGGRLVVPAAWDGPALIRAMEEEGVRSVHGLSPEMASDLLAQAGGRLQQLATINFYGAPPPLGLVAQLKAAFPSLEIGSGYGLTETNGSVAVACEHDLGERPGTAGRISPAADIRIVGKDRTDAPAGEVGEIWLSGPMIAKGYGFGENAGDAFEGGWLKTGDFGRLDGDRFLYLAEREAEVIQCGDHRLSAVALEQAAQAHSSVRDAAAFALPDPSLGQRPCLAVVLAAGRDCEELRSSIARSVDAPALVLLVIDRIPRSASGKVNRRALARQAPGAATAD
jgi:acyl-CoA synthetase (AMP-forming)/AMP-acid ligase II